MSMSKDLESIRSKLKHLSMDWAPTLWLDTSIPELNRVIGHAEKGIPYGRIIEMSGLESHGKTAIGLSLAALAQQDKALIVWGDLENSFNEDWARTRMLDPENMILIQPYVGKFGDEKEPRMSTAQELCVEMEKCITSLRKKYDRAILVVDSVPALLTEGEASDGLVGHNFRTSQDLPQFLGRLLRRWVGTAQAYNTTILLINQLRQNPMQRFGDPWYTPGGNATRFYSHIRVRVHRAKGGRITNGGKLVGIKGVMTALKNKTGGEERAQVGYRIMFDGPVEFVPASEIRKDDDKEEE